MPILQKPLKSLMASGRPALTQDKRLALQASRKRAAKAELASHLAKAERAKARSVKRAALRPHTAPTAAYRSKVAYGGPLPPVCPLKMSSSGPLPPQMRANLELARQRADELLAKIEGANNKAVNFQEEEEEEEEELLLHLQKKDEKKTKMMFSMMKETAKPMARCSLASLDHRLSTAITGTTNTKKKTRSAPAAIPPFGKHRRRQEAKKLKELVANSLKQPPMGFGGARKKFSVSKIVSSRQSDWKSLVGNAEVSHTKLMNHPANRRAHMSFRHKGAASEYESFRLFRVNRGFKSLVGVSDTNSFASRH